MRRPWRGVGVGAMCAAICSCSQGGLLPDFDEVAASRLSNEVDENRLAMLLRAVADSHANDTPIACQSFVRDNPLACHLSHAATRALLTSEIQSLGLAARLSAFEVGGVDCSNVVVDLVGTQAEAPLVLVGGHYDAYFTGADDNSSGTAALLELARVFSLHTFTRSIRLVAFDLEELGLQGSSYYVSTEPLRDHGIALILDSLGIRRTAPGSQPEQLGVPWPSVGDFLMVQANLPAAKAAAEFSEINGRLHLSRLFTAVTPNDADYLLTEDFLNSDHVPFWLSGVPTLSLSDLSVMRDSRYHSAGDVYENVDTGFLAANVRTVAAAVAYYAGVQK